MIIAIILARDTIINITGNAMTQLRFVLVNTTQWCEQMIEEIRRRRTQRTGEQMANSVIMQLLMFLKALQTIEARTCVTARINFLCANEAARNFLLHLLLLMLLLLIDVIVVIVVFVVNILNYQSQDVGIHLYRLVVIAVGSLLFWTQLAFRLTPDAILAKGMTTFQQEGRSF